MAQRGQLIRLKQTSGHGEPLWAYRYRLGGRDSQRVQHGGFASQRDAAEALERELERLRRERRLARSLTCGSQLIGSLPHRGFGTWGVRNWRPACNDGFRAARSQYEAPPQHEIALMHLCEPDVDMPRASLPGPVLYHNS